MTSRLSKKNQKQKIFRRPALCKVGRCSGGPSLKVHFVLIVLYLGKLVLSTSTQVQSTESTKYFTKYPVSAPKPLI